MHQGQRAAALGSKRLQERQVRLERNILMSRSIDAARSAPQNEPQLWKVPEQDYVRNRGVKNPPREGVRPSPTSLETLMNVSMHMQAPSCWGRRIQGSQRPPANREQFQMNANASISRAKTPTAMIVFVAPSKPLPSVNRVTASTRSP
jgi:hypothetical protein